MQYGPIKVLKKRFDKLNSIHIYIFFVFIYTAINWLRPLSLTGDEPHYAVDAFTIFHNQSRQVLETYRNLDVIYSIYGDSSLSPHLLNNMTVTFHGVGMSLLLLPAIYLLNFGNFFHNVIILYSALVPALTYRLIKRNSEISNLNLLVGTLVVFCLPPFVFYGNQIYPELPAALLCLLALNYLTSQNILKFAIATSFANYLYWIHIRFFPFAFALLAYGIFLQKKFIFRISLILVSATSITIYEFYNLQWYKTFDPLFQRHFLQSTITTESQASIAYRTFFGHFFSGSYGMFPWNPILIFSICGLILYWRKKSKYRWLYFAGIGIYLLEVAIGGAVGGLVFPSRYLVCLTPLWVFGLAFFFEQLKNYGSTFRTRMIKIFITLIAYSFVLIPMSYYRIDNLYGRGDFQNSSLVPIASQMSNLFPDFSSSYPDTTFEIRRSSKIEKETDFTFYFLPPGTYKIKVLNSSVIINSLRIYSNREYFYEMKQIAKSDLYFKTSKFQYVGGKLEWANNKDSVSTIEVIQISPTKNEFPNSAFSIIIIYLFGISSRYFENQKIKNLKT